MMRDESGRTAGRRPVRERSCDLTGGRAVSSESGVSVVWAWLPVLQLEADIVALCMRICIEVKGITSVEKYSNRMLVQFYCKINEGCTSVSREPG